MTINFGDKFYSFYCMMIIIEDNESALEQLRSLCTTPGYIYVFAYLVYHHEYAHSANTNGEIKTEDLQIHKQPHIALNESELLLLQHMMCEQKIETSCIPSHADMENKACRTCELLSYLHASFIPPMLSSAINQIQRALTHSEEKSEIMKKMLNPAMIREMSQYDEDSGYVFQYLPMSAERYGEDSDWMLEHLGFSSMQMQQTVDAAVEDVKSNFQDLDGSVQTLLESFSISEEQISDRLAGKVNIKQVNSVLDFFSMQEGPLARFEDFGDYNPCVAKPIVVVDDKRYLFLASSLCKATYESPFYPMIGDSEYKNTHSEHRGRFTEKFVYDRLCTVFGPDYVYKNIKLYHGNDVSDEIDVMAVVADRAILVQCKSKLMTQQAQQGDLIKAKKILMRMQVKPIGKM